MHFQSAQVILLGTVVATSEKEPIMTVFPRIWANNLPLLGTLYLGVHGSLHIFQFKKSPKFHLSIDLHQIFY